MTKPKKNIKITEKLPRGLMISSFVAIFFVLALLPFIAWLLEYKDTISAPLTITTEVTPVDIYARTSGELRLLVTNNAFVEKDAPLAVVRNTAIYEDVQLLKNKLAVKDRSSIDLAKDLSLSQDLEVGELKPALVKVVKSLEDYQTFLGTDQHQALINSRRVRIEHYENRRKILFGKREIIDQGKTFEDNKIAIDEALAKEGVVAKTDLELRKQDKLIQEIADLTNETDINTLDLNIEILRQESIELTSQFLNSKLNFINPIKEALRLLENEVSVWELKYLLKANVTGRCVFKEHFNDYRFVRQDEKIFSLIPKEATPYFALLQLPIQGAGKVAKAQEVYVKLNNYPFMEFGVLKGTIRNISSLPFDEHYNVKVDFASELITTYGDTIKPQALMHGIGEVIVERKTLYERISEQVKSARLNR